MTTANVMNPGMSNVIASNAIGSKTTQDTAPGSISKMFQGYMKQYDKTDAISASQTVESKAGSGNSVTDYAKTQYKGNQIQQNSQSTLEDKVSNSKDLIQSTEKEIVQAVAEELGFDEAEVDEVMETLGLSALQLLQPENLVQLVSRLTGTTDPAELLVNVNFQDLMKNMATIGNEFFQAMDVQPNQLDEIVAQMDILEEPVTMQDADVTADSIIASNEQDTLMNASETMTQDQVKMQSSDEDAKTNVEVVREETVETTEDISKMQGDEAEDKDTNPQEQKQSEYQSENMDDHLMNTGDNHVFANNLNPNMMQTEAVTQPPVTPMYSQSVNQLEIIQQIAEQVKVTVGTEKTSMEMQLNPENLGKVYLEVSTKQGNVNAQITAQNEAVREAIQAQIATLQDKLNQAGVKVDAIEVTVASHEFERNLEQDQNGKEQSENQSEQMRSGRRNLHLNSLDDLEGLMTEEEMIAAQIMKDNGNTVDLTA